MRVKGCRDRAMQVRDCHIVHTSYIEKPHMPLARDTAPDYADLLTSPVIIPPLTSTPDASSHLPPSPPDHSCNPPHLRRKSSFCRASPSLVRPCMQPCWFFAHSPSVYVTQYCQPPSTVCAKKTLTAVTESASYVGLAIYLF